MKATQGHLRLDQSYKLESVEYNGKYSEADLTAICYQCENCEHPIANLAHVRGSIDGKEYIIGLDCAATLTSIEPSEIAQAKKQLAKEAKFRKWIMESMLYWTIDPEQDGIALLYETEPRSWDYEGEFELPRFDWRCSREKYNAAFDGNIQAMAETARILRNLADKIQSGIVDFEEGASSKLKDVNGNNVGTYTVTA